MGAGVVPTFPIGTLVEKVSSWNPPRDAPDKELSYIDLSSVDNDLKAVTANQVVLGCEAPSRARQSVRAGDILVSTVRPNLNGVARVPHHLDGATASTGFCVLRPKPSKLDLSYLFHWVMSDDFIDDMVRKATGASYPAVSDKIIFNSEIPLPPIKEQKRIAAILDQADDIRRKRQHAIDRLNQLGQAIFYEMFGDLEDGSVSIAHLGDLTSKIGSGATPKGGDSAYKAEGIPLVRSMNVRDGKFSSRGLAFIDEQQAAKLNNVVVQSNDVFLNITGASVARVCRAPAEMEGARVNQHVSIIRLNKALTSEFLEAFLLMPKTKATLLAIADSGATRQAITKTQIESLAVPVPSQTQQEEFTDRLKMAKQSLGGMVEQSSAFGMLFTSLQHRAFAGGL